MHLIAFEKDQPEYTFLFHGCSHIGAAQSLIKHEQQVLRFHQRESTCLATATPSIEPQSSRQKCRLCLDAEALFPRRNLTAAESLRPLVRNLRIFHSSHRDIRRFS